MIFVNGRDFIGDNPIRRVKATLYFQGQINIYIAGTVVGEGEAGRQPLPDIHLLKGYPDRVVLEMIGGRKVWR